MSKRTLERNLLLLPLLMILAGCGCKTAGQPPRAGALAPEASAVAAAISAWPSEARRPFFMTIHAYGRRISATGMLSQQLEEIRLTAVTEVGALLFDARADAGQVTVTRLLPAMNADLVRMLVGDFSLALQVPRSTEGLTPRGGTAVIKAEDARDRKHTHTFGPGGQLQAVSIRHGLFDSLCVRYLTYDSRGWPREMELQRPSRHYRMRLTFTDTP